MALAWMNSAGVHQMIGYTVPTWFGYAGWGCLDYFVEQPGRYTFTEAFFANHHALVYCLENDAGNQRGLQFDRDAVAFYGDPAWAARMADGPCAYEQELRINHGVYTFKIRGNRGADSFKPINKNGSQRGWRPIVEILLYRLKDIEIVDDGGLKPVVADDFILIPNPREYDPSRQYEIRFKATRCDDQAGNGTPAKPYRTIQKALDSADGSEDGAEDVICIAGTFCESLVMHSGGADVPAD
jgi:zinc protease